MRIKLKSKDKIEVIIPGYAVRKDIVRDALSRLKELGYVPLLPAHANRGHSFHAQTDEVRFALLKKALLSKNEIVWSLRGGYGSNRLMPALAKLKKPKQKKLFIGISDVTSIHAFLNQVWKWPSLHASLLDRIGQKSLPVQTEKELWNILSGQKDFVEFKKLKALNSAARKNKKIVSKIVGGNLMTLQSLLGTPWQLNLKSKILFIEEIGERGYRIDRMLEHMKQAGSFKGCQAILVGHISGGQEPNSNKARGFEAIQRFAKDMNIPVLAGIDSGHDKNLRALPFLTEAVLDLNKKTLKVSCRF